jgi:hypothetical protein
MSICLGLHTLSDSNMQRILEHPPLIWRLIAPDEPALFEDLVAQAARPGFFSRLLGKQEQPATNLPSDLILAEGEEREIDLDKAWHGIHYCLNRTDYEAEPPMDFITTGGTAAGCVDVGYGPARLFDAARVKQIHDRISGITTAQLREHYEPGEMDKLKIYPEIWSRDGDEGFDYIADHFESLKAFIDDCVTHHLGMAVYHS